MKDPALGAYTRVVPEPFKPVSAVIDERMKADEKLTRAEAEAAIRREYLFMILAARDVLRRGA